MYKDTIDSLIKESMKNGHKTHLKVLRLIKSEYQLFEKSSKGEELTEAQEVKILKRMLKQWTEEKDFLIIMDRDTTNIEAEIKYLDSLIPQELPEADQRNLAKNYIEKFLLTLPLEERKSMAHLKEVIQFINKDLPRVTNKIISEEYKKLIS